MVYLKENYDFPVEGDPTFSREGFQMLIPIEVVNFQAGSHPCPLSLGSAIGTGHPQYVFELSPFHSNGLSQTLSVDLTVLYFKGLPVRISFEMMDFCP